MKPSNILLGHGPSVRGPKLTDFGVSKIDDDGDLLTEDGGVLGTLAYMAPEQLRAAASVTAAADVYAVGAILYHASTGRLPYRASSAALLIQAILEGRCTAPGVLNGALSPALDEVIRRAMAAEPSRRFTSARDLGEALLPFARGRALPDVNAAIVFTVADDGSLISVGAHLAGAPEVWTPGSELATPGRFPSSSRVLALSRESSRADVLAVANDGAVWAFTSEAVPNAVVDGTFEGPHADSLLPWDVAPGQSAGIDVARSLSRRGANNGYCRASSHWNALNQWMDVAPSTRYRASAWIRTTPNVTSGFFSVRPNATDAPLSERPFGLAGAYQLYTFEFDSRSNAKLLMYIGYFAPDDDSWVQFDDVSIVPIGPSTSGAAASSN